MLENDIRENLQLIKDSIDLIEERFKKINSSEDFVSNTYGIFVLFAMPDEKNYPKHKTRHMQYATRITYDHISFNKQLSSYVQLISFKGWRIARLAFHPERVNKAKISS
jgi:hypothetical protein